jgi:hypothetical protein
MSSETKKLADERLTQGLAGRGALDARETYRALLRSLKAQSTDAFTKATRYYEQHVLPRLTADADPLDAWIDYGRIIGELSGTGRMMIVDETGRAAPYLAPLTPGNLVMFVPDDTRAGSFVAVEPAELSAAQRATVALLVEGRLTLQERG